MNIVTEIAINHNKWHSHEDIINEAFFNNIISKILVDYPQLNQAKDVELSVLLTNNDEMQKLNKQFRKQNKPTNVLSFPEYDVKLYLETECDEDLYLGDIAFGFEKIETEAQERDISFINHFTHLTIHSILHLLGYDHIEDKEADLMEQTEIKILKQFDIKSPY